LTLYRIIDQLYPSSSLFALTLQIQAESAVHLVSFQPSCGQQYKYTMHALLGLCL